MGKHFPLLLAALLLSVSCIKYAQPSDVVGTWRSVSEEWTITTDGVTTKESYQYKDGPTEQSADLVIYNVTFTALVSGTSRTFGLEYSDRFSPMMANLNVRVATKMTVNLKNNKLMGTGETLWGIRSSQGNRLEIDYDSGKLNVDGADVRRQCRFVFVRTK